MQQDEYSSPPPHSSLLGGALQSLSFICITFFIWCPHETIPKICSRTVSWSLDVHRRIVSEAMIMELSIAIYTWNFNKNTTDWYILCTTHPDIFVLHMDIVSRCFLCGMRYLKYNKLWLWLLRCSTLSCICFKNLNLWLETHKLGIVNQITQNSWSLWYKVCVALK